MCQEKRKYYMVTHAEQSVLDYLQVRVNFGNIEIIQLESGIPLDI
jgi:hypothetical protein